MRGPGGEGMLHNMCCHELALAATRFGVSCDRIRSVSLLRDRSELIDLGDGSADWSKVVFKVLLEPASTEAPPPARVRVSTRSPSPPTVAAATFCASFSAAGLVARRRRPPRKRSACQMLSEAWIERAQAEDPLIRPYFLQQAPDYEARAPSSSTSSATSPACPTASSASTRLIEALRLADLLKLAPSSAGRRRRGLHLVERSDAKTSVGGSDAHGMANMVRRFRFPRHGFRGPGLRTCAGNRRNGLAAHRWKRTAAERMVMASAGPDGTQIARAYARACWRFLAERARRRVGVSWLVQIGADGFGPRVREAYATLWIGHDDRRVTGRFVPSRMGMRVTSQHINQNRRCTVRLLVVVVES